MNPPKSDPPPPAEVSFWGEFLGLGMHFYQFHIGDYKSHTHHLSPLEDLAFRRLLDHYYLHEAPIKQRDIARQIGLRDYEQEVLAVLNEFFISTENGFINPRADAEITKYRKFSEDGKKGAAKRWHKGGNGEAISPPNATPIATNNQEPITNNHSIEAAPIKKPRQQGSRLASNWVLPKEWEDWAKHERPDLNLRSVGEQFRDYWSAKTGSGATKLDWQATWRNWVRNQRQERINPADIAKVTVPSRVERDPALVKLDEDRKNVAPPNPEILEKLKMLRGRA
jgi:uncharacterized protein YdaU (DUF1376 family)